MNYETIKSIIEDEEKNFNFNDFIINYIEREEIEAIETIDELRELLQNKDEDGDITNAYVVYYLSAIDYLRENDPSLNESLELANDYGYDIKSLNSELLASILKTENNRVDYVEFIDNVCNSVEEFLTEQS